MVVHDGEEIALDWYPKHYDELPASTPTILLIPGVNSDSRCCYARDYAMTAYSQYNFRTAVFNRRGTSRMAFVIKDNA